MRLYLGVDSASGLTDFWYLAFFCGGEEGLELRPM